MTLQKIEFECDIPDGYEFYKYGLPEKGEYVLDKYGYAVVNESILMSPRILLKKISSNTIQTTKRHKYADLIHAWAEGAEIQWKDGDYWKDIEDPGFYEYDEYRIKPKTKTIRFRNWYHTNGRVYASHSQCEENGPDFVKWLGDWQEVEVEE